MDAATEDELRMLRRRAYGPGADIATDPAALDRLRQLEPAAARVDAPVDPPAAPELAGAELPPPDTTESSPEAEDPAPSDVPPGPSPQEEAEAETPRRSRLSRRTILLWVASVVAALLVGAGITSFMSATGGRVASIAEADITEWPTDFFGDPRDGASVFEAYEGLQMLVLPNAWGDPNADLPCLFVMRTDRDEGTPTASGIVTLGCGAGDFPPTASFTVTARSPQALRDRFAEGTDLRIVLAGDEVHVYAR